MSTDTPAPRATWPIVTEVRVDDETPIARVPRAIPARLRGRWIETGRRLYAAVDAVRELPDGYACRLPSDEDTLRLVVEYVSMDLRCCPFVRFCGGRSPSIAPTRSSPIVNRSV